jgi:curved DNA-binding protein CbpA
MSKLNFYESEIFLDYYDVLGIEYDAEPEEIKKSYFELVKEYHPDQGGSEVLFRKVNEAYEILRNEETRREYDVYYVKGNADNFANDEMITLKQGYDNYIEENKKEITEDEKDKLYLDVIKTVQDENKRITDEQMMTEEQIQQGIHDLDLERKNAHIEEEDDTLYNLLNSVNSQRNPGDAEITVSDLFDFFKHKKQQNNNTQLINNNFMALNDINNPLTNNFNFIDDNLNDANSAYFSFYNSQHTDNKDELTNFIKTIDTDEFSSWKQSNDKEFIEEQKPVTENDFEKLLEKRRMEEKEIHNKIEDNLNKHKEVMNLVEGGNDYKDNLNFFNNFENPFEEDLYGSVIKEADKINNINDVSNVTNGLKVDSKDIVNDINGLKNFMKVAKNNKNKEKPITEDDIDILMSDRDNIKDILSNDNYVFDTDIKKNSDGYISSKYEKPINNVVRRKSKFDDVKTADYKLSSESKLKHMINSNNKTSVENKFNINLEKDLGDITDYFEE